MSELLVLRGVDKSYLRGKRRLRVLRDIALTVAPGEIVAVVGSRGEGKSTLLRIASSQERPDAGEVWFGGRDVTRLSLRERERLWRDQIVWVSRETPTFDFDMLEHVALPLRVGGLSSGEVEEVAMAALERVGLTAVARRRWDELSNWERVLVSLAFGIARKPRLLVIDDVIDGLGVSKTREAGELLCSLTRELGCGVLMSASDAEATLLADRVWSFSGGGLRLISDRSDPSSNVVDFPGGGGSQSRGSSGLGS
jgi:ABC-type lipoprotein export system ATPase subunit